MQLSAEIIVDEEIDQIERFFYMQCIKIRFSKQTHVMFYIENHYILKQIGIYSFGWRNID